METFSLRLAPIVFKLFLHIVICLTILNCSGPGADWHEYDNKSAEIVSEDLRSTPLEIDYHKWRLLGPSPRTPQLWEWGWHLQLKILQTPKPALSYKDFVEKRVKLLAEYEERRPPRPTGRFTWDELQAWYNSPLIQERNAKLLELDTANALHTILEIEVKYELYDKDEFLLVEDTFSIAARPEELSQEIRSTSTLPVEYLPRVHSGRCFVKTRWKAPDFAGQ